MVPRFGLAGVEPAHGDQAEPEVADFGQQPMQRGLVSEQPADDRLLALAADLEGTADDWNGLSLPARGRRGRQPAVTLIAHSGWSEDRWWR
jgi:hypothetical protein